MKARASLPESFLLYGGSAVDPPPLAEDAVASSEAGASPSTCRGMRCRYGAGLPNETDARSRAMTQVDSRIILLIALSMIHEVECLRRMREEEMKLLKAGGSDVFRLFYTRIGSPDRGSSRENTL